MTPPKNHWLPRKKVQVCLRIAVGALLLLYFFNVVQMISHYLERTENGTGMFAPVDAPSMSQKSERSSSSSAGYCALTLLYYYMSASLLWIAVICWRKRYRRLVLIINITFFAMRFVQSNTDGYCKMTGAFEDAPTSIVARSDRASWSDSYSPNQIIMGDNIRISFRLHDPIDVPYPDKFVGVPGYRCDDRPGLPPYGHLPPSLSRRTILNFTTTIATDLKIAFIGDSISEQFAQAFDAAVLGVGYDGNRLAKTYRNGRDNINLHNCLSIAAPIRGGGVSAFWRVATLMSMSTRSPTQLCAHSSRMWSEKDAALLLEHRYSERTNQFDHRYFHPANELNNTSEVTSHIPHSVKMFDAIVLRLPHGWLTIEQITKERIVEAINLLNMYLGAKTVIISTLPLNNNVRNPSDWEGISNINTMVRDIARSWVPSQAGSVRWVLVQEFGNFTNQVVRVNAKHIELTTTSTPDFSQKGWELSGTDFLLKRLSAESFWNPSIAMVCAEQVHSSVNENNKEVEDCIRSKISRDGCHWCVDTLGPRYAASVACLLGCVHNGEEHNAHDFEMVRHCEHVCNDRFMSILPVDKKWIGGQISLSSKSV